MKDPTKNDPIWYWSRFEIPNLLTDNAINGEMNAFTNDAVIDTTAAPLAYEIKPLLIEVKLTSIS